MYWQQYHHRHLQRDWCRFSKLLRVQAPPPSPSSSQSTNNILYGYQCQENCTHLFTLLSYVVHLTHYAIENELPFYYCLQKNMSPFARSGKKERHTRTHAYDTKKSSIDT